MSEMKPCPFCGSTKICTEKSINLNYCDNCSAESNVEQWNTRPIEDALTARIAELEAEIDQLTAHDATERQDDKWIPVSERLPEVYRNEDGEFIPFLVCEGDGDRPFIAMYGGTNWWAGIFVPDVTHWMPLPELPEVK